MQERLCSAFAYQHLDGRWYAHGADFVAASCCSRDSLDLDVCGLECCGLRVESSAQLADAFACGVVRCDGLGHKVVSVDPDYLACVLVEGDDGAASLSVSSVRVSISFASFASFGPALVLGMSSPRAKALASPSLMTRSRRACSAWAASSAVSASRS